MDLEIFARPLARVAGAVLVTAGAAGCARAQAAPASQRRAGADTVAMVTGDAGREALEGISARYHMRMTAARPATHADSVRGAELLAGIRRSIWPKYAHVEAAEADGFQRFLPGVKQRVYHYTRNANGFRAAFGFDPARPTSLLYRDEGNGTLRLIGVMYTAPARWDEARLDARVPLSLAHWHQHVDICLPPGGDRARMLERDSSGQFRFGLVSPVNTPAACAAEGGVFRDRIFGWMVHVNAFDGGNPWADDHGGHEHDMHDMGGMSDMGGSRDMR